MIVRKRFAIFVEVRGEANDVSELEQNMFDRVRHSPHSKMSMWAVSRTHDAYDDEHVGGPAPKGLWGLEAGSKDSKQDQPDRGFAGKRGFTPK